MFTLYLQKFPFTPHLTRTHAFGMRRGDCKVNAYIRSFVCFLYLVLLESKYMPLQCSSRVKTKTLYEPKWVGDDLTKG